LSNARRQRRHSWCEFRDRGVGPDLARVWRGVRVVPGSGAAWGRCCTTSALIPAA
jgi:hypothetical protein